MSAPNLHHFPAVKTPSPETSSDQFVLHYQTITGIISKVKGKEARGWVFKMTFFRSRIAINREIIRLGNAVHGITTPEKGD